MNAFVAFVRFAGWFMAGCAYFSLWKYSVPATVIVTAVYWWTSHRPSHLGNPYRSVPTAPTDWLSPNRVAASIGLLTTVITVVAEQ